MSVSSRRGMPGTGRVGCTTDRFWRSSPSRAQDAARAKLHHATASGDLEGIVHAYLGMPDERIPVPLADLVPLAKIQKYPADFKAMAAIDLHLIATRGEQLTRTLIAHYCPQLK
jgi:hypothetical protein